MRFCNNIILIIAKHVGKLFVGYIQDYPICLSMKLYNSALKDTESQRIYIQLGFRAVWQDKHRRRMPEVQSGHYRKISTMVFISDNMSYSFSIRLKSALHPHFSDDHTLKYLKVTFSAKPIEKTFHIIFSAEIWYVFEKQDAAVHILPADNI